MKRHLYVALLFAALVGMIGMICLMFSPNKQALKDAASIPTDKPSVVLYVDVSDQSSILTVANIGFQIMKSLPNDTKVTVIMFAHDYEIIYTGPPTKSRSSFNAKIGHYLTRPSAELRVPNTNTLLVLEHSAQLAKQGSVCVVAVGDGGLEDRSPATVARIKQASKQLSSMPNIRKVTFMGVLPEHRRDWTNWLQPLGHRAIVNGRNDFDNAIREVARW